MKILVFGSNGLVGSNIKSVFSSDSDFNCVFSTRKDTNLFSFEETKKIILKEKPNLIINSAAKVGGIVANDTQRTDFLIENLKINLNILESLKNLDPIKFINLGSSCIYPLNSPIPINENQIMNGPLEPTNSAYAMAKLVAIELGASVEKEFGHNVINLMPTNLYGTNDNYSENSSHVIPGLIRRMHEAKKINKKDFYIWGTGKPLREFLNAADLAKAIRFIIKNNIKENILNIGSNEEISISSLANMIQRIVKFDGQLLYDHSKPDGNPRKLLDSKKIFQYGWKPEIELENGIKEAYEWFLESKYS